MLLFNYILIVLLILLLNYYSVYGYAGLIKPIPRSLCDSNSTIGCKIVRPCHKIHTPITGYVNPININEKYEYAVYQLKSKANETSFNTYTVLFFKELENTGYQLFTFNQNDMVGNKSSYGIIMDPIISNVNLLRNIEFDKDSYVYGTLELTFDARSGGGDVYYSCANVRLQKKPYNSTLGKTIEIQATLTLTDIDGSQLGSIETDGMPTQLFIPDLVERETLLDSTVSFSSSITTSLELSSYNSNNNNENNNQNSALKNNNNNSINNSLITIVLLLFLSVFI